jgi:hypothetical protein
MCKTIGLLALMRLVVMVATCQLFILKQIQSTSTRKQLTVFVVDHQAGRGLRLL